MLGQIGLFADRFAQLGWEVTAAKVVQILSEDELIATVPDYDGWIIGDDPATAAVFAAGKAGKLRAAVKWGIGVDNVDFAACRELDIPIINTPNMFGAEVADIGICYLIGLARETFAIDRAIRNGDWLKPAGISPAGRTLGLIGLGDIGTNFARRALACGMRVIAYDPGVTAPPSGLDVEMAVWPNRVDEADFLGFTCALNAHNFHMLNADVLASAKDGVRIINVARGPLIDEAALIAALQSGKVHSAALDVFEVEPLPTHSPLRAMDRCIFGSHNGSNSVDAVIRASHRAIEALDGFLTRR
ncbi:MAG: phosphoglycerate dehydrogenase [Zymomonas sp.]|nr:phosphoglycerate dehydrogenase [Zymomonas sp.]